jgi:hypothetical protein
VSEPSSDPGASPSTGDPEDWDEGVVIYGPAYTRALLLAKAEAAGFPVGFQMDKWNAFLKSLDELELYVCKVKDDDVVDAMRTRFAKGSATPEDGFRLRTKKKETDGGPAAA